MECQINENQCELNLPLLASQVLNFMNVISLIINASWEELIVFTLITKVRSSTTICRNSIVARYLGGMATNKTGLKCFSKRLWTSVRLVEIFNDADMSLNVVPPSFNRSVAHGIRVYGMLSTLPNP